MRTYHVDKWAKLLGWPKPRRHKNLDPAQSPLVWFESGASYEAGLLQINLLPILCGCAFALNYQICSGFVPLEDNRIQDPVYCQSIAEWLLRDHFATLHGAETYGKIHPECAGQTWETIRERGYPYRIQWVEGTAGNGSYQRLKLGCSPQ